MKYRNIAPSFLPFFFHRDWLETKMLREKRIRADNFPGDSEKERSSIVLYRETRASGYNADGSSSILTAAVGDKNDRRKETIKERIAKKKQAGKRIAKKALLGAPVEREKQGARKCPQIITKIIHQRISHFFSLSFYLSFVFLIYVFSFCQYQTFSQGEEPR